MHYEWYVYRRATFTDGVRTWRDWTTHPRIVRSITSPQGEEVVRGNRCEGFPFTGDPPPHPQSLPDSTRDRELA